MAELDEGGAAVEGDAVTEVEADAVTSALVVSGRPGSEQPSARSKRSTFTRRMKPRK
jgi:hypothetical protein